MTDYEPVEIRGYFRAYSQLPIWEVLDKAGIWEKVGINMRGMEYCASPPEAEPAMTANPVTAASMPTSAG